MIKDLRYAELWTYTIQNYIIWGGGGGFAWPKTPVTSNGSIFNYFETNEDFLNITDINFPCIKI